MSPEIKHSPLLTDARTDETAQDDQRVFAEILRYKAAHDGLSPAPIDLSRAVDISTGRITRSLDRLSVVWKINVLSDDFSRITVPGARWLPPGEPDTRPFHVRRDCTEMAAENDQLRKSLENATYSWRVYQDRVGLLEAICKHQAQTIDRLRAELAAHGTGAALPTVGAIQAQGAHAAWQSGHIARPVLLA